MIIVLPCFCGAKVAKRATRFTPPVLFFVNSPKFVVYMGLGGGRRVSRRNQSMSLMCGETPHLLYLRSIGFPFSRRPLVLHSSFFTLHLADLCNENWSKFNTSKTINLERQNRFEALMLHFGFVNGPLTDRKCTTYES